MPPGFHRREMLHVALGLAALPLIGGRALARDEREGRNAMAKDIVMIHGANEGGWCFDTFKSVFEGLGWTCHTPDLIGHGTKGTDAAKTLVGVGMADYRAETRGFSARRCRRSRCCSAIPWAACSPSSLPPRVWPARSFSIAPAPRSGILPPTDAEKQLDQDLMALGPIWKTIIDPDFAMARIYTLNRVPEAEQHAVFDKFGPESGRAFFELFFWMFDQTGATAVDTNAVRCPVLCLVGADDKIVSPQTARATAAGYPGATFWELEGHGHMLVLEPGAEDIARRIADWIPA